MLGRRQLLLALTSLLALAGLSLDSASAAEPRLPASLYPAEAHITYRPSISNHQMDCLWGFFCEGGVPLFHALPQTLLHRETGWAQFAGSKAPNHMSMRFALFASHYGDGMTEDARPWAAFAFADFIAALHAKRCKPLHVSSPNVAGQTLQGWTAQIERSGPEDLIVMAGWGGRTEIEGIVMYDHASTQARATATTLLRRQVQQALQLESIALW